MNSKSILKVIPGKTLTWAQNIVCLLLVLVICVMSFGPIFTLDVNLDAEAKSEVNEMISNLSGDKNEKITIPDKIEVSLPFIFRSAGSLVDVFKGIIDMADNASDAKKSADALESSTDLNSALDNVENINKNLDEAEDKAKDLVSQDLVNLVVFFVALFSSFGTSFVVGACHLFLLVMVFAIPITAVISALLALIAFLSKLKNPQKAFHRIAKSLASLIALFPMMLLIMVLIPEVQFGSAVFTMLALCCVSLVANLIVSRLKYYEKPDFKYLNVLQILSACSFGAFLIFFFNITKSGIVDAIFKRLGSYAVEEVASAVSSSKNEVDFLSVLLILVFVVAMLFVFKYLTQIVTRLACMAKSKSDSHIVTLSIGLVGAVIPFVLMNTDFKLALSDEKMSAYILSFVGVVLMFVVEIVMKVLSLTLCADTGKERRREILTGTYVYEGTDDEAEVIEEKAVTEEEKVVSEKEVVVPEEAPVAEKVSSEEAIMAEAVVEEAVAVDEISEAEGSVEAVEATESEEISEIEEISEGEEATTAEVKTIEEETIAEDEVKQ